MTITTRNADLGDLAAMLKNQQARKVDLVTPATTLWADNADITVAGSTAVLTDEGVTRADGRYRPTAVFDEGLAEKLNIPLPYVRRMRAERPDLYDANVNGWLYGGGDPDKADPRSFLLRTFKPDNENEPGIARALLSNSYAIMDNLDALTAALDGVAKAGVEVVIDGADLTERRMVVRVTAPEVKALAPDLLRGYRSPFTGETGDDNPTLFAGFQISNSETGGGAFTITPRLVVQVCRNGMTVTKDAMRAVHLGGKMDDGLVRWSEDTQQRQLALITAKTSDAVRTFLDVEYMRTVIDGWNVAAGKPVETVDEVREHTKRLGFTTEQIDGVLGQFIKGGQMTLGGVTNAITAYSQTVTDGDEAYALESKATDLLSV